jgi:hypothetical protein
LLSRGGSKTTYGYETSKDNLTWSDAVEHWKGGSGADIRVPLSSIDLSSVSPSMFPGGVGSEQVFNLARLPLAKGRR